MSNDGVLGKTKVSSALVQTGAAKDEADFIAAEAFVVGVFVKVELQIEAEDDEDPEDVVEWCAFGFIFVIATLSFSDARPRGHSDIDYAEEDQFMLADLIENLTFGSGGLKFHGDYIRGRSLKTDVVVKTDGAVMISTWGRGESLLRWLDKLKGKKQLKSI